MSLLFMPVSFAIRIKFFLIWLIMFSNFSASVHIILIPLISALNTWIYQTQKFLLATKNTFLSRMRRQLANIVRFSTLVPLALRHYVSVILPLYSLFIYQYYTKMCYIIKRILAKLKMVCFSWIILNKMYRVSIDSFEYKIDGVSTIVNGKEAEQIFLSSSYRRLKLNGCKEYYWFFNQWKKTIHYYWDKSEESLKTAW